ncbi:replication factor C small subunit / DNA polymerase clamp loader subunit [Providencia phage PSTCR6]|nr:replication factor C small subunit / DNA polymerase clamp loader subunit [Providencia phage PSTCR6]
MISVNQDEIMFEEKYRPQTIEECILPAFDKAVFTELIKKNKIPHLLLQSNSPGTGKTTLAKVLAKETGSDVMFKNGADCTIDFIRNELTRFASSGSLNGKRKIIIIDEFDRAKLGDAQRHLRTFMEAYSKNCSVIITANDLDGILPALRSRCRVIQFGKPTDADKLEMMKQMILRCEGICELENIKVEDRKVIASLVKDNFPDFRKCINLLDFYSQFGKIDAGILSVVLENKNDIKPVVEALKNKDIKTLRTLAIKYSSNYSYFVKQLIDELYPLLKPVGIVSMYEILGENNQLFNQAANQEIHLMYAFVRLAVELTWNA